MLQAIHTALQTLHDQQGQYWRKLPELAAAVTTLVATKVGNGILNSSMNSP